MGSSHHDQTHPYAWAEPQLGLGWHDAGGVLHEVYPIFAYHDLYRRIYAMAKQERPDAFLLGHMSGKMDIPVLAYEDMYMDGEQFRGTVKDSYSDVLPLDMFRAEFMGRQWGVTPMFSPALFTEVDLAGPRPHLVEPTREAMALALLHDVGVMPLWTNYPVVSATYDALDAFGYADAEFIPYFDKVPPATTALKNVYASVYKRSDGRALAIIGNLSRENRAGVVHLNARRIGLPLDHLLSWPDKTPLSAPGGNLALDIPERGLRMIVIGKAP